MLSGATAMQKAIKCVFSRFGLPLPSLSCCVTGNAKGERRVVRRASAFGDLMWSRGVQNFFLTFGLRFARPRSTAV